MKSEQITSAERLPGKHYRAKKSLTKALVALGIVFTGQFLAMLVSVAARDFTIVLILLVALFFVASIIRRVLSVVHGVDVLATGELVLRSYLSQITLTPTQILHIETEHADAPLGAIPCHVAICAIRFAPSANTRHPCRCRRGLFRIPRRPQSGQPRAHHHRPRQPIHAIMLGGVVWLHTVRAPAPSPSP